MAVVYLKWKNIATLACAVGSLLLFCEFIIYYIIQIQCTWPRLSHQTADPHILPDEHRPLKVMLLADTHLLGVRTGHWFDKLRREWQMWRAFQTAMMLHEPHAVFILGDVFDEGMWASPDEFSRYLSRFYSMFYHSNRTKLYVIVGNHDIGFHYMSSGNKRLHSQFQTAFGDSVRLIELNGNVFVTINSMAMEGDGCDMCEEAVERLAGIERTLACSKRGEWSEPGCRGLHNLPYSQPVLLLHFPLYRASDVNCTGPDAAGGEEKLVRFREQFHCLSRSATRLLLDTVEPRLVLSGHTHHGCYTEHPPRGTPEHTVASFSWRNINNPSYLMLVVRNNNHVVSKCYLPTENTVIYSYVVGAVSIVLWQVLKLYTL